MNRRHYTRLLRDSSWKKTTRSVKIAVRITSNTDDQMGVRLAKIRGPLTQLRVSRESATAATDSERQ